MTHDTLVDFYCLYDNKYLYKYFFTATVIEQAPLEEVFIFFDTATYDEIERDVKVCKETLKIIQSLERAFTAVIGIQGFGHFCWDTIKRFKVLDIATFGS